MDENTALEAESSTNPTDLSMEAILELAELKEGLGATAPSLDKLIELLRSPTPSFAGTTGASMLADVRSYAILRDSLNEADPKFRTRNRAVRELLDHKEVQQLLESFFEMLQQGIAARDDKWIEVGRRFCSAINSNFLSRQMNDIYSRRERSDARYIGHEFTP